MDSKDTSTYKHVITILAFFEAFFDYLLGGTARMRISGCLNASLT